MGIKITVMSGAEDGKVFELNKMPVTLGRHPDDDVSLPFDARVSRHHARLTLEGGHYFIWDTGPEGKGSTNGIFINDNGNKISEKTALSPGDLILLGNVWVKFDMK